MQDNVNANPFDGDFAPDWMTFLDTLSDNMPKTATPLEIGAFLVSVLDAYKPDPYMMQYVLSAALTAYANTHKVPEGATIN